MMKLSRTSLSRIERWKHALRFFLLIALFLPAVLLVPSNIKAQTADEFLDESRPIVQIKGNLEVTWYLVSQWPYVVNISVRNLLRSTKQTLSLETIFSDTDLDSLAVRGFYEWENKSYIEYKYVYENRTLNAVLSSIKSIVNISKPFLLYLGNRFNPFFANVTCLNGTVRTIGCINYTLSGDRLNVWYLDTVLSRVDEITRYHMVWEECKMQYFNRTASVYRQSMGEINIGKSERKWFRIVFNPKIETVAKGYKTTGKIALNLSNLIFDPWWNASWSYRKSHVINSAAGAGTNYQVRITVHYGSGTDSGANVYLNSHCRTDFGDVRFVDDNDTTSLDYWMESKTDGDNAIFWVEVADDLSSANATIYVYYGNPSATTTSNGPNTFTFFDDFSTDPSTRWTVIKGTAEWDSTNLWYSITTINYGGDTEAYRAIATSMTPITDMEVLMKVNLDGTYYLQETGPLGRMIDNDNGYGARDQLDGIFALRKLTGGSSSHIGWVGVTVNAHTWYWIKLQIFGSTIRGKTWQVGTAEPENWTNSVTDTTYTTAGKIGVCQDRGGPSRCDDVRVRKYVDPEPSHGSWGSEENGSSPPVPKYQFTFDHKDYDGFSIDSIITWKLYNGSQLLNYAEGEYTLTGDHNYTLKTIYPPMLVNVTEIDSSIYANSTITIKCAMRKHYSVANGYIALNVTPASWLIYSETPTNLTFVISGSSSPVHILVDVKENATYVQKNDVNVTDWVYHHATMDYITLNSSSMSKWEYIFPADVPAPAAAVYYPHWWMVYSIVLTFILLGLIGGRFIPLLGFLCGIGLVLFAVFLVNQPYVIASSSLASGGWSHDYAMIPYTPYFQFILMMVGVILIFSFAVEMREQ